MWHALEGVGKGWGALGNVHVAMLWLLCIARRVWIFSGRPSRGERATGILNARLATRELSLDEFGRIERERLAAERRG